MAVVVMTQTLHLWITKTSKVSELDTEENAFTDALILSEYVVTLVISVVYTVMALIKWLDNE
jgi:hypothetical protein